MPEIADMIKKLHTSMPQGVEVVAVSKFHPIEKLREAYDAGQRIFGESRQQELLKKIPLMPDDVRWHFIGHLQTNKVRPLIGHVAMIESVDSEKLLRLIDAESERAGVTTNVLLQVHVAQEETKFGFLPQELFDFFSSGRHASLKATRICGIMGMASNTDLTARIQADFEAIRHTMEKIKEIAPDMPYFSTLSMGMSHDYPIAIKCGANLVRIGTMIFGEREY